MMRPTASKFIFTGIAAIALACAPNPMFAQHGGGHGGGGGGSHGGGGGGFHGGGAPAGGARSYGGGGYGGGSYRAPGNAGGRSASSARPSGNSYRPPAGNSASGRAGASSGSSQAARDGQWHSFGSQNSVTAMARGSAANSGAATRSFAGQGHQLYEEGSRGGVTGGGLLGGRSFATVGAVGGLGFRGGAFGRAGLGFGFPAFGRGFGFGGFGWGFGFGFGFGWGGCFWDPFCFDSFAAWPGYGYPGYGYGYPPPYGPAAYPPSVGYDPDYPGYGPGYDQNPGYDQSNPPPGPPDASSAPPAPLNPNWDTSANAPSSGTYSQVPVVIYLKDGTSFSPSDYWISDTRLHYVLGGQEYSVDVARVNLPRTNEENHKSGATFWLKSAPDGNPAPVRENNGTPGPVATPPGPPDATVAPIASLRLIPQGAAS